ncbi:hypothetical protein C0995_006099 [Termitomyces sp. Mi166|nr:hypothetical protein C0995_006099 [Termitomyces sp. Mi166\
MPAITRKGFIDVTSIDLLIEPSQQWEHMNRVLKKYNLPIYQHWGALPRDVLPSVPEQVMLDRVMNVAAITRKKALKNNLVGRRATSEGTTADIQPKVLVRTPGIEPDSYGGTPQNPTVENCVLKLEGPAE